MALNYKGIRKGYPRLRKYFGKFVAYIQLCRVFTGLAPLMAGLLGALAPVQSITLDHIRSAIYVGVTLMLSQFCGQIINQYSDVELDRIVKPYRPIPSGLVSREEALGLAWLLALFSIARAFTLTLTFGLITLTLIFFAVFYSLSPFSPRKIHPILNILWMAISRGLLPVIAVWSIYGSWEKALPYALLGFTWVLGFQPTKDIEDVEGDKRFGIKTIPGEYGQNGLRVWMIGVSFIFLIDTMLFELYLMLPLILVAIWAIVCLTKRSKFTENTQSWTAYYLGLGLFFLFMFLSAKYRG